MKQLYLDANAHVPMSEEVLEVYKSVAQSTAGCGHASSPSIPGRDAQNVIESSRAKIASLLGCEPSQIFFTGGCSEACNWIVDIINSTGMKISMSEMEHPSVKYAVREKTRKVSYIKSSPSGLLSNLLSFDKDDCLICIYAQNEIGTIQPIESWNPGLFFSDMSQALGKLPIDLKNFQNIDFSAFGAHKFGGPGGIGIMYLKDPKMWKEYGKGSRYFKDRIGTPDVPAIAATAKALEGSINSLSYRAIKMIEFRDFLEKGLIEFGWRIVGKNAPRIANTTYVKIPNSRAKILLDHLGQEGIYVGLGSACGSNFQGSNPLMNALGVGGGAGDFLRISQYGYYGAAEAKVVLSKIKKYTPFK